MEESLIRIENLSFKYHDEMVLEHVNLNIDRGEFLGVIGPNGSGKSTLIKIIVGLLKPTSGTVTVFGTDISQLSARWRIGYVPQRAASNIFSFPVTVAEIVGLGLVGRSEKEPDAVRRALNAVSMHKYKDRLMSELSGGQQQRVFIARALVGTPEILLLDEPTVGVDSEAQSEFYELLRRLNKELHLTLVLVSHDIDMVSQEVSSIACLNKKLLGHVTPQEFKREHLVEKMYGENLKRIVHNH